MCQADECSSAASAACDEPWSHASRSCVALFLIVIAVFWFDRDGLRDHADGSISFTDVVYFTMVSVTTVGYGDIVPVTRQARLVDAMLVTPIRLFIWLIFIGTAHQLVLQRLIEEFRMRRLQADCRTMYPRRLRPLRTMCRG